MQLSIPVIISPRPPVKNDVTTRITNRCLSTWGFASTTFTAEECVESTSWSVTVERNIAHATHLFTGHMFGVGLAKAVLNVKDMVAMNDDSCGLVCAGGELQYCENGEVETLTEISSLPVTVTACLKTDHPKYNIVTFRIQMGAGGPTRGGATETTLLTKRVIRHEQSKSFALPVFTVSQKVKLHFLTSV